MLHRLSSTRDEIDLNGEWNFAPQGGGDEHGPAGGWARILVPGNWKESKSIIAADPSWGDWKPAELAATWYERKINIPADWAGRAIVLDVDRVSTDAVAYVDGLQAGSVNWPGGQINLSAVVKPGATQTLRLRVIATDNKTEVTSYMGYVNEPKSKATLDNRGLIGTGVRLIARPKGPSVFGVYVRPGTRQKKLDIDIERANLGRRAATCT